MQEQHLSPKGNMWTTIKVTVHNFKVFFLHNFKSFLFVSNSGKMTFWRVLLFSVPPSLLLASEFLRLSLPFSSSMARMLECWATSLPVCAVSSPKTASTTMVKWKEKAEGKITGSSHILQSPEGPNFSGKKEEFSFRILGCVSVASSNADMQLHNWNLCQGKSKGKR